MDADRLAALDAVQLDELLSADLDGELAAALADLVIRCTAEEFRSWVAADPHRRARSEAMQRAQRVASIATPPIDDITRKRLVRDVVAATPASARRNTTYGIALGGVAAAVVLVVGIATSLGKDPARTAIEPSVNAQRTNAPVGGNDAAAPEAQATTNAPIPDLGAVADAATLAAKSRETVDGKGTTTTTPPTTTGVVGAAEREVIDAHCLATLPGAASNGARNAAVATVGGSRLVAARGLTAEGNERVWVYRLDDCSIVFVQ